MLKKDMVRQWGLRAYASIHIGTLMLIVEVAIFMFFCALNMMVYCPSVLTRNNFVYFLPWKIEKTILPHTVFHMGRGFFIANITYLLPLLGTL